jgi:hypothetical protein
MAEIRARSAVRDNLLRPGEVLRFNRDGYGIFHKWLEKTENRHERRAGSGFGAHIAKYPGLFARLALVWHFMKHGPDAAGIVDVETAVTVRDFIDGYLEPHARRIYGVLGAHPARQGALRIAQWIRADQKGQFTVRDIRRSAWREFAQHKDVEPITAALDLLEAYGWIKSQVKDSGPRGDGQPSSGSLTPPCWIRRNTFWRF